MSLTNHDLSELADPGRVGTIYENYDLYNPDGTFFHNLVSRPLETTVPIGETLERDIELYIRVFEGDYRLATSLYRKEGKDDFVPLVINNTVMSAAGPRWPW